MYNSPDDVQNRETWLRRAAAAIMVARQEHQELGEEPFTKLENWCQMDWRQQWLVAYLLKNEVSKRLRGYRPDRRIGANGPEGAAVIIKEIVHERLLMADGLEGGREFRARQQGKAARTWECSYDEPMII